MTEALSIVPMRSEHVEQVKRVIATVVCELFEGGTSPELVDRLLAQYDRNGMLADLDDFRAHYFDRNGMFLVLLDGERVVGTGGLRPLEEGAAELKRMWFLPEYRGRGLGRQMAEQLLDFARSRGYRCVRLDTGRTLLAAQKLYRALGFREISRYNDNPHCEVFMEVSLTGLP